MSPILQIVLPAAALGFGATAVVQVARRRHPALAPTCWSEIASRGDPLDKTLADSLPLAALLTASQFPILRLSPRAQRQAFASLRARIAELAASDHGITDAYTRVHTIAHTGARASARAIAPQCAWPDTGTLADLHQAEILEDLEKLAVVALAEHDGRQIRVDADPVITVIEDPTEACVPEDVLAPFGAPTILAPEIGDMPDDVSWTITHPAQAQAYQALVAALSDPEQTAPVSQVATQLAPDCPWGRKASYGLSMTILWYAIKRLLPIAQADLAFLGGS